jgi:NitT/TauT family transport system permease protein
MALFGFGETTIVLTVVLFAIWIIILDSRAGSRGISPSLIEMAASYGATRWQAFTKVYLLAALPEILAGIRLGLVRAVKGVIIGQLLVSVIGFGYLFEIYSSNFLMEHMWALLLVLFLFAYLVDIGIGELERRVDYYSASRQ